jgi:hypothetical protein
MGEPMTERLPQLVRRAGDYIVSNWALAFLLVGVTGLILSSAIVDHFIKLTEAAVNADRHSVVNELRGFRVEQPDGSPIGWLSIKYSRKMRDDEDAPFEVSYVGDRNFWSNAHSALNALTVSVRAANLSLQAEPYSYEFDLGRIRQRGFDNHIWTVTSQKHGDYSIVVNLQVVPDYFRTIAVAINNEQSQQQTGDISLRVSVYTMYYVSELVANMCRGTVAFISFLLTLPAATIVWTWYSQRRKQP